jgi:hypothetical protein
MGLQAIVSRGAGATPARTWEPFGPIQVRTRSGVHSGPRPQYKDFDNDFSKQAGEELAKRRMVSDDPSYSYCCERGMRGEHGVAEFAGWITGADSGCDVSSFWRHGERDNHGDGNSIVIERDCQRAIPGRRKEFRGCGNGFALHEATEYFDAEQWDS